jgi:cytochrome oxidase Cu insertion factor (SCO1/SenC/PrrC family)
VFIYDKSYLKKSETYDMAKELNEIYSSHKDKVQFIGIIEGYVENENELKKYLNTSKIVFEQIDNTKSQNKPEILNYNMFCSPSKILINRKGKVIYSSCGGGDSDKLTQKLDSIKNNG